ncbi:hypothetical protein AAFC00_004554 [Neodothiora populina]|uniref:Mitochondrial ATPase n=1 Tax=Neodothiora populina TaxID=2781224 RepID=A0ABR3P2Q6_9PEZI
MSEYRSSEYHRGPIAEYDFRVKNGTLRNDDHQRTLIQALQDLHDELAEYTAPPVQIPSIESLQPKQTSFFGRMFGSGGSASSQTALDIPDSLPKGMYMYGDVGSGKTMMMDLFHDTLPPNIKAKKRIHFHNFMQEVHRDIHKIKLKHGNDIDAIPFAAAQIANEASVLCFDEFQCTDVADAMILRRLVESLMHHGTVIVTTSNRHPTELYKNGVQRDSFIPCINLLLQRLTVINLDSTTDYRKIPRPASGVYHHPLDKAAKTHAENWFKYFGDLETDPPHPATHTVWGRPIHVPHASGKACMFDFEELLGAGSATGAADYIELMRNYHAFVVTNVPQMDYRSRDVARRFITFIDAVYESHAKLVLTTAVPLTQLFLSRAQVDTVLASAAKGGNPTAKQVRADGDDVDDAMRMMMDDLGMTMDMMKKSNFFSGDEEAFAFARALSRLSEMQGKPWVERGMGLAMGAVPGKKDVDNYSKTRSKWSEDNA